MDHAHVTEFGSDQHLRKINQAGAHANAQHTGPSTALAITPVLAESRFILPLRGSDVSESIDPPIKPHDQKRLGKKSILGFRSKFHAKHALSISDHVEPASEVSSAARSRPFDDLFHCLPNELQFEIIASLPLSDILNLRLTSRPMHAWITLNEAPIARYHLDHYVPTYARRLYPVADTSPPNLYHLCGIWHRLHVAAKLSYLMCEWISTELFLRNTVEKKREFAPQRERMRRRLIPLLFTVFHFFETYRTLHLKYLARNNGKGLLREPYTVNPIEAQILNMYDDRTLLRVHESFPLVLSSFCRRLRPPSYVGRVERSLRGYLREKPPDEVHVAILCIGGLREVERIWEVKGYNMRRTAVDNWYSALVRDPIEPEPKKRRGILGLKRKKSSIATGKPAATQEPRVGVLGPSDADITNTDWARRFVFTTSLSSGAPMGSLPSEQAKMLLADLPVLQKIWLETAEAMILDRKIVERASDIKRNTQVITDLIREDGFDEEDQWWFGTGAFQSVCPNSESIEEDVLE